MINFIPDKGTVTYNDFNLNLAKPINSQTSFLKEDLLQIVFSNNYLLDLGWYPEGDINGNFVIQIVKDYDWDKPVYKKEIDFCSDVFQKINDALNSIE